MAHLPIQKPTNELYADWLMTQNRLEEAAAQYKLSLKKGPKRLRALDGVEKTKNKQNTVTSL